MQRARASNPGARLIVKMDKGAHYGIVADMVAGMQQSNMPRFIVQTNLKQGAGTLAK